jgi:hypothetical protein
LHGEEVYMYPKSFESCFFRIWIFSSVILVTSVVTWVVLSFAPNSFLAQAADTYGPACGMATIDGIVNPVEWSGASTKTFQMINPNTQKVLEVTLRVKNDSNFLYLGLMINDDEFSTQAEFLPRGDIFRIDFDNDHNGSLFAVGDDNLSISAGSPQFEDGYIVGGTSAADDTSGGGTSDGIGAASRQSNLNHFELKHPLCSGDQRDFCLHPGDVVGFRLEYLDASASGTFDGSYFYPGPEVTSIADIIIADCSFIYLPHVSK